MIQTFADCPSRVVRADGVACCTCYNPHGGNCDWNLDHEMCERGFQR